MNKRVAKPKQTSPLYPDENITDAEIEQFLRDNHAQIARKLAVAQRQAAAGLSKPMGSLEEFLQECRKYAKRRH